MQNFYRHLSPKTTSPAWARIWLMSDERMGDALLPAIAALPRGSGVIFRHYSLASSARRALFDRVRALCRKRGLWLLLAGTAQQARAWGADGAHGTTRGALSAPAHNRRERSAAERRGVKLVFVSPVFATQSHPGARALGPIRFGMIIRDARVPVIALGGMTRARARALRPFNIYGWAGIDGLMPR
jgi:thiamine-phosphate pyrophosphorylase